jgi:hypothetical protein
LVGLRERGAESKQVLTLPAMTAGTSSACAAAGAMGSAMSMAASSVGRGR